MNRIVPSSPPNEPDDLDENLKCAFIPGYLVKNFNNPHCPFVGNLEDGVFTKGRLGQAEGIPITVFVRCVVSDLIDSAHRHHPREELTCRGKTFQVPPTLGEAVKVFGKGCRACLKVTKAYLTNEMKSHYLNPIKEVPSNLGEKVECPVVNEDNRSFVPSKTSLDLSPEEPMDCFGKMVLVFHEEQLQLHFCVFDGEDITVFQHYKIIEGTVYENLLKKDKRNMGGLNMDILVNDSGALVVKLKDESGKFGVIKFQKALLPHIFIELETYFKQIGFENISIDVSSLSR